LNGIGIKTQSFGRIADPFVWNFILEKDMDEEDKASQSLSTSLSSVSSSSPLKWGRYPVLGDRNWSRRLILCVLARKKLEKEVFVLS